MSTLNTPNKTPAAASRVRATGSFGTPMFIPPTPQLQNLGYGTGVSVYRIERSPLNTGHHRSPWALKRITRHAQRNAATADTYRQRLADEASILRRLDHPNIVGFRGLLPATADGRASLAMEMCDTSLGDLLEGRLERGDGPLPAAQMRRMCADVFRALDYLHTVARLLHGDIKSYNVLVKDDFAVCKLCDFGVSLPLDEQGFVDVVAKPDARYVGTHLWCAPEAMLDGNERNVSTKADVFSVGLVIYECVALVPPHLGSIGDDDDDDEDDHEKDVDDEEDDEEDDGGEMMYGTRPPLPDSEALGSEYNVVVELFYVCTNQEPEDRPSPAALVKILDGDK